MKALSVWLTAIGIVMVIEGVPYMTFPAGMKKLAQRLPEVPDSVLRVVGLIAVVSGFALVLASRPG